MTSTLDLEIDLLDPTTPTTAVGWKERQRVRAAQAALRQARTDGWPQEIAERITSVCTTARSSELRRAGVIRPLVRRRTLAALDREAAKLRQLRISDPERRAAELDEACQRVEGLLVVLETTEHRPANREPYLALWRDVGGSG